MCGLREGNIQNCCSLTSPKNAENEHLKQVLPYGFKVQDYMGNSVNEQDCHLDNACVYRACNEGEKGCFKLDECSQNDNHCKKMNNYYKCKFSDVKTADINEDSHFIVILILVTQEFVKMKNMGWFYLLKKEIKI